jgi:hypothetical protein
MNSIVVWFWRWMSISSSVTAACTDTSSAETGSSATTTLALPAKARATPMRCFWPPDKLARHALAKGARQFDQVEQFEHALAPVATVLPILNFSSVRMICEPTEWLGLSVSNGFWNTIWMAATVSVSRFSIACPGSAVAEHHGAVGRGLQPQQHLGQRGLAAAGFADDRDGLALARLELRFSFALTCGSRRRRRWRWPATW